MQTGNHIGFYEKPVYMTFLRVYNFVDLNFLQKVRCSPSYVYHRLGWIKSVLFIGVNNALHSTRG
jgi:hypothetical protein